MEHACGPYFSFVRKKLGEMDRSDGPWVGCCAGAAPCAFSGQRKRVSNGCHVESGLASERCSVGGDPPKSGGRMLIIEFSSKLHKILGCETDAIVRLKAGEGGKKMRVVIL